MVQVQPLVTLLVAACEMGDSEVVDALLAAYLDGKDFIERRPDGSIHIAKKFLSWDTWDTTNYYIRPMVESIL